MGICFSWLIDKVKSIKEDELLRYDPIEEQCLINEIKKEQCLIDGIDCKDVNILLANNKFIDKFPMIMSLCVSISITNCPNIHTIPNMKGLEHLEIFKLVHSTILVCNAYFPNSLRTLDLSYNSIIEFVPQNLPTTIAEIDLSFNKLKTVPPCIETLYNANHGVNYNFRNNDFWFSMYSNINPSYVYPGVIDELILAHKLNLISTCKIRYCKKILEKNMFIKDAKELARKVNLVAQIRILENTNTIYTNAQNVHLTSVQSKMKENIKYIMSYVSINPVRCSKDMFFLHICDELGLKNQNIFSIDKFRVIYDNTIPHSLYGVTFSELLYNVYNIICDSEHKETLLNILRDEIKDGINTCSTGQITRIVNTLNMFVPEIKISISKNEEISNTIIAMRKKYKMIYEDEDMYITETIPIIMQFLEDMCISEAESMAWIEYV